MTYTSLFPPSYIKGSRPKEGEAGEAGTKKTRKNSVLAIPKWFTRVHILSVEEAREATRGMNGLESLTWAVQVGILRIFPEGTVWRRATATPRGFLTTPERRADYIYGNQPIRRVAVTIPPRRLSCAAHVLVWRYFSGHAPTTRIVHLDEDRTNNHPDNLSVRGKVLSSYA